MGENTFNKVRKRDEKAFIEMMQEYKQVIYYTALTYFKNSEQAIEAVQEVTFRAYKNIHKVKKESALKAWLTRITINYCLDEIKKHKRFSNNDSQLDYIQVVEDPSTSLFVSEALQTLQPNFQTIIILKYQQDLTLAEIAASLKMPIGTVKTHLNRALKILREFVKEGGLAQNEFKS